MTVADLVRPMKRGPITTARGKTGAKLGTMLEVQTEKARYVWSPGEMEALWIPSDRALVIMGKGRGSKPRPIEKKHDGGKAFERWSSKRATKEADYEVAGDGRWYVHGKVTRIDYRSDKHGRTVDYTHDSKSGARMYHFGSTATPLYFVVRGGDLRVTRRGLEG